MFRCSLGTNSVYLLTMESWTTQEDMPQPILIYDDHAEVAEVLEIAMDGLACFSVWSTNEISFKSALEEYRPALIAVDLFHPNYDGFQILQYLRDQKYDGDIVLISGAEQRMLEAGTSLAEGLGLSVLRALRKPFSLRDWRSMIGDWLLTVAPAQQSDIAQKIMKSARNQSS